MKSKTAELTYEIALKMYQGTDESLHEFAIQNFPELGMKITDRVKTFHDACQIMGTDPNSGYYNQLRPHENAQRQIETIVEALNEGWVPNLSDLSERKYYPYFVRSSSGSGFSYDGYGYDNSGSLVRSRQYLKSSELAVYAGKQFTDLYKVMLTQ